MKQLIKNHVGSLIAWIAIVLIAIFALPNVNALTREHSEIKLPSDVQSSVATQIEDKWGHKQGNTYVVGVVFNKKSGKISADDQDKIDDTIRFLKDNKKQLGIKSMMTPNDNFATKDQLISKDKTTEVVQLNVANDHSTVSKTNKALTKAVKTKGIRTYVTGVRILEDDFSASVQEGIKKTEVISIIFIFIVLVLVFRSPIVPLISLLTVGVSFITSFSIVTNLVQHVNFPFSNFTQVFMVIVLFGIGTDYNILLYDKFKENLGKGMEKWEATRDAQHKAGRTILYSGSSILIGFSALGLAQFSVYQSAAGVAVGVAVLLVVLLTLNPFFMAVLGEKMFWPVKKFEGESSSKLWHGISKGTLRHPVIYLLVIAVVVAPFFMLYSNHLNYDDADEISDSTPSKAGLLVLQDHFSKGTPEYSTLYIRSKHKLDNENDLKNIDQIVKQIQADPDVKFASAVTQPNGEKISKLYVNNQLGTVNSGTNTARNGLTKLSDGSRAITNGAIRLQDGANQLQSGTVLLQNGAGRLESGTLALQQGAVKLQNGTFVLVNGANTLHNGTQQLVDGLNLMSTQLAGQMNGATKQQLAQLQQALPQINSGIQELNKQVGGIDISGLTGQLSGLEGQVKQSMKSAVDSAVDITAAQTINALKAKGINIPDDLSKGVQQQVTAGVKQQAGAQIDGAQSPMPSSDVNSLASQVTTLQAAVKQLAAASNVALPGANSALTKLQGGLTQVQGAVAQGAAGANRVNNGAGQLAAGLQQGANGAGQLSSGATALYNGASQLNAGLAQGANGASQLSNGLGQIATNAPQLTAGIDKVNDGLGTAQTYLGGLSDSAAAKTFYIPDNMIHSKEFQESIDNYMSSDLKATKIIIILKSNPASDKAAKKANSLSNMVKKSVKGTSLQGSTIAMGGQSEKIYNTQQVSSEDFVRTAAIMLIGIGLALIFITRSVLQPIFILGTLLIAYITSLSICQWLIKPLLGRDLLTWNTPFFSFIMLIALGVDYSIFLMMRYRELGMEQPELSASKKILHACTIIGTVVVSAAIILGGTFAALIPSGVPTLIEVAMAVIIGLLLLVFLIPVNMSAAIKITYEGLGNKKKTQEKQ